MLDLWAPADCTCSAFCSDPDGLRANGLTFAAEADKPARDGTLNYTPVGYKKRVSEAAGAFLVMLAASCRDDSVGRQLKAKTDIHGP